MRVAVTGALGMIGRAVRTQLEQEGHEVLPIDHRPPEGRHHDLAAPGVADAVLAPAEAVVHLAGRRVGVAAQQRYAADLLFGNLAIDLAVLAAARRRKIPGVYASTVSVYPAKGYAPLREDDANGFPAASVRYSAWGKLTAERLIEAVAAQDGLRWTVVRLVNTYGPHDDFGPDALVIPALIRRVCTGESPLRMRGDGRARRDVLYVEDAARGLLLALKATKWSAGLTHVFNIGTGLDYSVREITGAVLTACGVPVHPVLWGPEQELGAAAKVVVPSSHLGFQHKVSLADGLARTVAWYRENCTT